MKKSLLFLITLITLTACLAFATACQNDGDVNADAGADSSATEGEQTAAEAETEQEKTLKLDGKTYGGEEITFLVREGGEWTTIDIFAENLNAETVNDKIINRNLDVEELLDVKIRQVLIPCEETYNELYTCIAGGDSTYDAVDINGQKSFVCAQNELLIDLTTVDNIDLTAPWWDQTARNDLSIGGKLFYTMSDINLMSYKATWVTMFNKKLMTDLGYEDGYIYNLVREGKWTLDEYYNIVKGFTRDLNDDNAMTSADMYGTSMQTDGPESMLFCAGFRFVDSTEDGFKFHSLTDRDVSIFNKVLQICGTDNAYNSHNENQNDELAQNRENGRNMFAENRSIFFLEPLDTASTFRDMDADFGIVPFPKFDELQEKYYSHPHHWAGSFISIPNNCDSLDATTATLEAMSYYSYKDVTPAYFDLVVESKVMRDTESYEMLTQYIMPNRIYDFEIATKNLGISAATYEIVKAGNNTLSSLFARYERTAQPTLDEINSSFGD